MNHIHCISFKRRIMHAGLCLLGVLSASGADMTPEQRTFFESKIRPVLVKECYECHSQSAKKLGGKLLLDAPSEMIAGGESGASLIPGKPDDSLIIQALRYDGLEMPPKKRLPDQVVADFVTWVKMGAPDPRAGLTTTSKPFPAADKSALWSYQPISKPKVPEVNDHPWGRDPIDHFILAGLERQKIAPAKDAPASVLLRRLTFNLTGLPPTSDQAARFDGSQTAVKTLVDELLNSPHYGERWGRHWLDVVRYAESNGNDGLSRNASFPHAWRYRDYVINAFNADVPYDRFVTEQIAGDLLPAASDSERDRQLIATGFLAIGSKPAKAMNDNFDMDVVADQIAVISSGIMGLSVGCARCHDHKTDPIPTRDYYALAGILRSTETLWGAAALEGLTAPQTPLHELKTAKAVSSRPELEPVMLAHKPRKAPSKSAFNYTGHTALSMGVREGKSPADCKLNIDGDAKKLGAPIPRGFISACGNTSSELAISNKESGRLQLARWITSPTHPHTARVIVNRVWQHLFGTGIVSTPDDFGITGERPSHPELLDHLAAGFIEDGWSIKRLIRRIVLTRTYQLASDGSDLRDGSQREERIHLFGQHQRRRLDAESIRDAMLMAAGRLDVQPAKGSLIQGHDVLINELPPLHQPSSHRSVYLLMLRNSMPPDLVPFNLPDAINVAGKRDASALTTQALYLLNNPFITSLARQFAGEILKRNSPVDDRIVALWRQAFGRKPTDDEMNKARDFIKEADLMLASSDQAERDHQVQAWAALCQSVLCSNELCYID